MAKTQSVLADNKIGGIDDETTRSKAFVLAIILGASHVCWALDHITVESKTVPAGATGVTIAIRMSNSDTLVGMALPLEIRSLSGGARPASLRQEFAERLDAKMNDIQLQQQYDTKSGVCGQTGDSTYKFPLTRATDTTVTVTHAPWGLFVLSFRLLPDNSLLPGEDSTGSVLLHMDMASTPGSFEIDTVCMDPAVHIVYAISVEGNEPNGIIPSFTKAVITVVECNCSHHGDLDGDSQITAMDLGLLIDHVLGGQPAPPADSSCPHVDWGDIDCSGFDDVLDVSLMIDVLYAGGSICDPCECDPYPTSCP